MSLRLWALNLSLRWLEKPNLVRATPQQLRHSFERKAWLLFHLPKGTEFSDQNIGGVGANPTMLHWVQLKKITMRGVILYLHGGAAGCTGWVPGLSTEVSLGSQKSISGRI